MMRKMFTGCSNMAAKCELFWWMDGQGSQTGEGWGVSGRPGNGVRVDSSEEEFSCEGEERRYLILPSLPPSLFLSFTLPTPTPVCLSVLSSLHFLSVGLASFKSFHTPGAVL